MWNVLRRMSDRIERGINMGCTQNIRGIATHFRTLDKIMKGLSRSAHVLEIRISHRLIIPLQSHHEDSRRVVPMVHDNVYAVNRDVRRQQYPCLSSDYLHIALGIEVLIVFSHSWPATLSRANDKPSGDANNDAQIPGLRSGVISKKRNRRGARRARSQRGNTAGFRAEWTPNYASDKCAAMKTKVYFKLWAGVTLSATYHPAS